MFREISHKRIDIYSRISRPYWDFGRFVCPRVALFFQLTTNQHSLQMDLDPLGIIRRVIRGHHSCVSRLRGRIHSWHGWIRAHTHFVILGRVAEMDWTIESGRGACHQV